MRIKINIYYILYYYFFQTMFNFQKKAQSAKPIVDSGTHWAYLISIVDMGTQETNFFDKETGQKQIKRLVEFTFEFPDFTHDFEGTQKPLIMSISFTLSMDEKAKLRATICSMSGKKLSDNELYAINLKEYLWKPYMVSVLHTYSEKHQKNFANIWTITSIPKWMTLPPMYNELRSFSLDNFSQDDFESLYKRQQEKIANSPEYIKIMKDKETAEVDLPF